MAHNDGFIGSKDDAKFHLRHCLELFLEVADKLGIAETMTALAELDFAKGTSVRFFAKLIQNRTKMLLSSSA